MNGTLYSYRSLVARVCMLRLKLLHRSLCLCRYTPKTQVHKTRSSWKKLVMPCEITDESMIVSEYFKPQIFVGPTITHWLIIIDSADLIQSVLDLRAKRCAELPTDHYLVVWNLRLEKPTGSTLGFGNFFNKRAIPLHFPAYMTGEEPHISLIPFYFSCDFIWT